MAGVRTSAVLIVASATLAAFIGGGGLGDFILRGHALARDEIMLAGAIPATFLAFYFEEIFGQLQEFVTPRGLKPKTAAAMSKTRLFLSLLAKVLVLPVLLGVLLPWHSTTDAGGTGQIFTGLHPGFRTVALLPMLLGLLAGFWPRSSAGSRSWVAVLPTAGAAWLAFFWLIVQAVQTLPGLLSGQSPQVGFFLLAASLLLLAGTTLLEAWPQAQPGPRLSATPRTLDA
jgi:hypothetical protein